MKYIILHFIFFISYSNVAQEMAHDFVLYKYSLHQSKPVIVLINDSLNQLYENRNLSVYSSDWEIFHIEEEYIKGNEKVNIIIREDEKILYRFFRDSNVTEIGELVIDSNNFIIEVDYAYDTIYGSDIIAEVNDTMYFLHPGGIWRIEHSNAIYEKGIYQNGKKEGDWITYDNAFGNLPIEIKRYSNGALIETNKIGIVNKLSVQSNLVNSWKGIGYGETSDSCALTFLMKDGTSEPRTNVRKRTGQLSILNLKKNGKFDGLRYYWCGTGNYSGDYWNPTGKWENTQINDDFFLLLNSTQYKIVYITDSVIILEICA